MYLLNEIHNWFFVVEKEIIQWLHLKKRWSPFGRGAVLEQELLKNLAKKYDRSTAQICLRWKLQHGVLPLPKSSNEDRMKNNVTIHSHYPARYFQAHFA